MDRSTLAEQLRAARFRTTQFRTGYAEDAVDDLVDQLVGQLGMGVADEEILATVAASPFPTTTARRGYEMADVDSLLDTVTTALGGTPAPASAHAVSGSGESGRGDAGRDLPPAIIEPPRGFLSRLLGR
ncbi:DivIVA domain-containing protein [Terrabacter carboxydivorans]|uniref:DivIVA domain-containing protein n=1 Tax=Terrabacter carboxydivorans TaxID=619730 RepID=A0ABN3LAL2_9MICO